MEKEFECIKIKDGLYLGNKIVACDLQFLLINKFGYVVNCAAQVPNLYQQHGIKYTKFKIKQEKNQNIFGQDFKRLKKIKKVIEQAEESGLCCLVHCSQGGNRSLVLVTAYLMDRFKWRLRKTLEYLQSKAVPIFLTDSNIQELTNFQYILSKEYKLSHLWVGNFIDQEQQLITKTFNNTTKQKNPKQAKPSSPIERQKKEEVMVEKTQKRVVWLDKIEKEQKKQKRRLLAEKEKQQKRQNQKSRQKIEQESKKDSKAHNLIIPKDKVQLTKKSKKKLTNELQPEIKKRIEQAQLLKLLKKSDKLKEQMFQHQQKRQQRENYPSNEQEVSQKEQETEGQDKKIYKLTINNYINPNINIIKPPLEKKKKVKAPKKEKDKFNRTYSEKQAFKKITFFDKPLSKDKQIPKQKRNTGYTPVRSRKQRKSQN